jgi:hypothetical protein
VNKGAEKDARASSDGGSRPESPALPTAGAASAAEGAPPLSIDAKTAGEPGEAAPPEKAEEEEAEQAAPKPDDNSQPDAAPRPPADAPAAVQTPPVLSPTLVSEQPVFTPVSAMAMPSKPSVVAPPPASPRQSLDSTLSRPSVDIPAVVEPASSTRDPDILLTELSALQEAHEETVRGHRDELNGHLERIDALQSKLAYLSQQLATSAKATASESDTPADKKLAEKDAQIAALMEEGQRLSKTEMKHLTTVKTLRAKAVEHNKEITTLKQRLSKAEKSITEQSERAKRAEAAERAAQDKLKIVGQIEKDIALIRSEREEAGLTINELRRQLSDALSRAEGAEKRAQTGALEAEKKTTASLKEDIENLRIEKKLAEDRTRRELQTSKEEAKSQQEKAKLTELELRGEIAVRLLDIPQGFRILTWRTELGVQA